ncbi:INCENP_ARK-bind domain-containing protein [Nephila pilipes]|uniref:INCENP_ARK-bind domain-containing protein n=1 Tax=Nephila pilipes TaxID=299642 RepID=A0A8X6PGE3_NEPPI|nr:INCENP_ARK-bind domain-containing protein [Nephila pilipes]
MIHEELLNLSRKADKIILSNLDNNMDFFKKIKEKALSILACRSLTDLEKHFTSEETKLNSKKHQNLWEESRVHLHSNRNSKENSLDFTDEYAPQVTPTSVMVRISDDIQNSNSLNINIEKNISCQDMILDTNVIKDHSNLCTNKSPKIPRQNVEKDCKHPSFENGIKISNVHSVTTSVEISSKSSRVNNSNGMNSNTNFTYEKYQNIDITQEIENNNEDMISNETVTVSTVIKTSFTSFSSEYVKEDTHRNVVEDSLSLNNRNYEKDKCNQLCIETLQSNGLNSSCEENFNSGNCYLNTSHEKDIGSFIPKKELIADYSNVSSDTEIIKNGVDGIDSTCNKELIQTINFEDKKRHLQLPTCVRKSFKEIKTSNSENLKIHDLKRKNININSESRPSLSFIDPKLEIPYNLLNENSEDSVTQFAQNIPVIPEIIIQKQSSTKCNSSNIGSGCFSEHNAFIVSNEPLNSLNNENSAKIGFANIHSNEEQELRKTNRTKKSNFHNKILAKDLRAICMNKNSDDFNIQGKYLNKSHFFAKTGYNLRSANNEGMKTNHEGRKKRVQNTCTESSKCLFLKKTVEEKRKLREQKMKLTQERRERLEKERREKLRRSENRRMNRFRQHEEILKRKKVDPKQKAVCQKFNFVEKRSGESHEIVSVPQASETMQDRTYLIKNSPNESVVKNTNDPSSNDDSNSSVTYDKKIFMRQSVVLTDVTQALRASLLQNSENLDSEKRKDQKYSLKHSSLTKTNQSKPSNKPKKNHFGVRSPIRKEKKRHIKSTRKIPLLSNENKNIEINDGKIKQKMKVSEERERLKIMSKQNSYIGSTTPLEPQKNNSVSVNISTDSSKTHTSDSLNSNLEQQYIANQIKDTSVGIPENLVKDRKLSKTPYVVLEKLFNNNNKFLQRLSYSIPEETEYTISSNDIAQKDPKLSVLKPVVVLKDISNNNLKLTHNSKNKNLDSIAKIRARGRKRKSQNRLSYTKSKKKTVIISNMSRKKQKEETILKANDQSTDVSSYEISDISDNSLNNIVKKNKKIPSWASGIYLKQLLLKQYYQPPDTDSIFGDYRNQKAIDLADIFDSNNSYHKRTSSVNWNTDESLM